jgi:hypothetical protein
MDSDGCRQPRDLCGRSRMKRVHCISTHRCVTRDGVVCGFADLARPTYSLWYPSQSGRTFSRPRSGQALICGNRITCVIIYASHVNVRRPVYCVSVQDVHQDHLSDTSLHSVQQAAEILTLRRSCDGCADHCLQHQQDGDGLEGTLNRSASFAIQHHRAILCQSTEQKLRREPLFKSRSPR